MRNNMSRDELFNELEHLSKENVDCEIERHDYFVKSIRLVEDVISGLDITISAPYVLANSVADMFKFGVSAYEEFSDPNRPDMILAINLRKATISLHSAHQQSITYDLNDPLSIGHVRACLGSLRPASDKTSLAPFTSTSNSYNPQYRVAGGR